MNTYWWCLTIACLGLKQAWLLWNVDTRYQPTREGGQLETGLKLSRSWLAAG